MGPKVSGEYAAASVAGIGPDMFQGALFLIVLLYIRQLPTLTNQLSVLNRYQPKLQQVRGGIQHTVGLALMLENTVTFRM